MLLLYSCTEDCGAWEANRQKRGSRSAGPEVNLVLLPLQPLQRHRKFSKIIRQSIC